MSDDETERKELAAEILRTVPMPRLISAVSAFLRDWNRRATGDPDAPILIHCDEICVREFMRTGDLRQLKLLREMAGR
jgi:hypothetical protein